MSADKVFIVLPAWNEEGALRTLVPLLALHLKPYLFEIVVVNDGSRDGTAALVSDFSKQWPLHEIRHRVNQGYGAALRSGYLYVLQTSQGPGDLVISMDSDGTQGPEFLPVLIDALQQGQDAVTASYEMPGGGVTGVPFLRRIMSRVINTLFHVATPFPGVHTYTNGFRGYRVAALRKVQHTFGAHLIDDNGFPGGAELFLKIAQSGATLGEVPFVLHYEKRGADSKIRIGQTIRGYLKLIFRARTRFI